MVAASYTLVNYEIVTIVMLLYRYYNCSCRRRNNQNKDLNRLKKLNYYLNHVIIVITNWWRFPNKHGVSIYFLLFYNHELVIFKFVFKRFNRGYVHLFGWKSYDCYRDIFRKIYYFFHWLETISKFLVKCEPRSPYCGKPESLSDIFITTQRYQPCKKQYLYQYFFFCKIIREVVILLFISYCEVNHL